MTILQANILIKRKRTGIFILFILLLGFIVAPRFSVGYYDSVHGQNAPSVIPETSCLEGIFFHSGKKQNKVETIGKRYSYDENKFLNDNFSLYLIINKNYQFSSINISFYELGSSYKSIPRSPPVA